ncbi:hypothetical protein [Kitasatospora sp. NPDC096204]|uniref:hypothetical protein n=1 Tax=Kitasatospora sp. NPDC096204 TaxID=3364094 RepID=UPI0037F5645F
MPQITLPDNTPWWAVGLLVFALAFRIMVGAVLPRQSAHRLSWWREWWKHRSSKQGRRNPPRPSELEQGSGQDNPPPPVR